MSVEKTKKVVRDFLLNTSAEVLSIKGDWGVGKTYFWNESITQTKDDPKFCREKYCYVSLFGVASLAELKATIFETYIDKSEIGNGFSWDNLMKRLPRYGRNHSKIITRILSIFGKVSPEGVSALLLSSTFHLVKNILVCIDDFERKSDSLPMKDVLGLISFLKEERDCKVALIFSDMNFSENDRQAYTQFREKVVDVEVRFSPTPAESAALVFTTSDDTQLSTFTNALQISNIRILRRIQKAACRAVPLLRDFDPQITRAALQTLALFGWCYYADAHNKNVPSYQYVTSLGYFGGGEKTEQQQGWDALLREYGFQATDELDIALSSLIENGFIDEELVRREAEKLNRQLIATQSIDAFSEAWGLFYSFHNSEEEVVGTFESLLKKHVMYVSPLNLNSMVLLLREIERNELASELIDFYVTARREDKEIFDLSKNLRLFGDKPDEELAHKFNLQIAAQEATPTIEEALAHLAKQEGWEPAHEEVLA